MPNNRASHLGLEPLLEVAVVFGRAVKLLCWPRYVGLDFISELVLLYFAHIFKKLREPLFGRFISRA